MIVRVVCSGIAGFCLLFSMLSSADADVGDRRAEALALSELDPSRDTLLLDTEFSSASFQFDLPAHISPTGAQLTLAARAADEQRGVLQLRVNGHDVPRIGDIDTLAGRFDIAADILVPGENTLEILFDDTRGQHAWLIDGRRSQLRLSYEVSHNIETLDGVEQALAADFARLRRIAIAPEVDYPTLDILSAQAVALRAGGVPIFTAPGEAADLSIRFDLNAVSDLTGPTVSLSSGNRPEIVISGRDPGETIAAARLFAARSFSGVAAEFNVRNALDADQLGEPSAAGNPAMSDLGRFASDAAPFAANGAARTAVVLTGMDVDSRTAAYSILSRMAVTSGEAWIYAWYGTSAAAAPGGRHLLVIGPNASDDQAFMERAPAELRAALRAANQSGPSRSGLRFAAAAYADDPTMGSSPYGVAAIFQDAAAPGRWIATFTAGEGSAFSEAAQSLTRSDLWGALEGRAAIWSPRGVTSFDFDATVSPVSMFERAAALELNPREAAAALFTLALLFMLHGIWRRRQRVHAVSKD